MQLNSRIAIAKFYLKKRLKKKNTNEEWTMNLHCKEKGNTHSTNFIRLYYTISSNVAAV